MATEIMFQAFKWDATKNGRIGDWYEYLEKDVLPQLVCLSNSKHAFLGLGTPDSESSMG